MIASRIVELGLELPYFKFPPFEIPEQLVQRMHEIFRLSAFMQQAKVFGAGVNQLVRYFIHRTPP
jgi:hypothetical protein